MFKEPEYVSIGTQTSSPVMPRFDSGMGESALATLLSGKPESLIDVAPFWGTSKSGKRRAEMAYERKAFRSSFAPISYANVDIDGVAKKKLGEALAVVMD